MNDNFLNVDMFDADTIVFHSRLDEGTILFDLPAAMWLTGPGTDCVVLRLGKVLSSDVEVRISVISK